MLIALDYGIYSHFVIPTDSEVSVRFGHRENWCCPCTMCELLQDSSLCQQFQLALQSFSNGKQYWARSMEHRVHPILHSKVGLSKCESHKLATKVCFIPFKYLLQWYLRYCLFGNEGNPFQFSLRFTSQFNPVMLAPFLG